MAVVQGEHRAGQVAVGSNHDGRTPPDRLLVSIPLYDTSSALQFLDIEASKVVRVASDLVEHFQFGIDTETG